MIGFCPAEQRDTEIGPDRKCLTDGAFALPPSTTCIHRRWREGAWTACDPSLRPNGSKPCKPVAAGTWRTVLAQQDRAVERREAEQARRQRAARAAQPPQLANAHKPAQHKKPHPWAAKATIGQRLRTCLQCGATFVARASSQGFCSVACTRARRAIVERACIGCGRTFTPEKARIVACSKACGQIASWRRRKAGAA